MLKFRHGAFAYFGGCKIGILALHKVKNHYI